MVTRCLLAAAAALALSAFAAPPAAAQTQRERQLERRIERLERELKSVKDELRGIRTRKPAPPAAPAKVARSGNKRVTLTVSGQVSRAVMSAWNKDAHNLFFVDNDNSSTRFRLVGRANIDDDWSVIALLEFDAESNTSSAVNQLMKTTGFAFSERKFEVALRHKRWGTIWIGQGDAASNGVAEKDISGTAVVGYSKPNDMGGPRFGRAVPLSPIASAPQIKAVFDNLDGLSRMDRVRIDSPKLFGFMVSVSVADDYARDVALHYSGEPIKGVLRVVAGVGFFKTGTPGFSGLAGSISALHKPTGLNLTFAGGTVTDQDNAPGRNDWFFYYVKGGWQFRVFNFGITAISVDYAFHKHVRLNNEEAQVIGVQLVQRIDAAATDLYIGVRHHMLDSPGVGPDFGDVTVLMTGARVKF